MRWGCCLSTSERYVQASQHSCFAHLSRCWWLYQSCVWQGVKCAARLALRVPALQVLKLDSQMLELAEELKTEQSLLVFGRGYNYATALEAALKVRIALFVPLG